MLAKSICRLLAPRHGGADRSYCLRLAGIGPIDEMCLPHSRRMPRKFILYVVHVCMSVSEFCLLKISFGRVEDCPEGAVLAIDLDVCAAFGVY